MNNSTRVDQQRAVPRDPLNDERDALRVAETVAQLHPTENEIYCTMDADGMKSTNTSPAPPPHDEQNVPG
jgi:hypothetical protein